MKIHTICWLAVFLTLFSACVPAPAPAPGTLPVTLVAAGNESAAATPAAEIEASATPAAPASSPTPTQRQRPTQPSENQRLKETLFPTPTRPVPTPTPSSPNQPDPPDPTVPLVWTSAMGEPQWRPDFYGSWSPTANEFAGFLRSSEGDKSLVITSRPDFKLHVVEMEPMRLEGFLWSPDGRHIIFSGLPKNSAYPDSRSSFPWMIDHDGQNLHRLTDHDRDYDILWFPGWMDEHRLLIAGYYGGGHWGVDKVDIRNGASEGVVMINGPIFQPNATYIPVGNGSLGHTLVVFSDERQPEEGWARFLEGKIEYSRLFPDEMDVPDQDRDGAWDRLFEAWLPGTNRLFFFQYAEGAHGPLLQTAIGDWNLDTDEIRMWASNGVDVIPSPDAKTLALTTLGIVPVTADGYLDDVPLPDVYHRQPFLNLLDAVSGKVLLQAPVLTAENDINAFMDYLQLCYSTYAEFSPDSRYLAFLSPGKIELDTSKVGPAAWELGPAQLNVLDLQSRRLVFTTPIIGFSTWSPKSDRLVYQKLDGNWAMYDLLQGTEIAITETGGWNINEPCWSFNGSYLSFETLTPNLEYPDYPRINGTAILTLPER